MEIIKASFVTLCFLFDHLTFVIFEAYLVAQEGQINAMLYLLERLDIEYIAPWVQTWRNCVSEAAIDEFIHLTQL